MAVGFEPTEVLPSHDFESCSFGRSDTPPPETLPLATLGEEIGQQLRALHLAQARDYFWTVVEPPVPDDVPEGAHRAGFRIPGAEDQPSNP